MSRIFMILKREWLMCDGISASNHVTVPAGRHEMERIANPFGHPAPWLVMKGTQIGATEGSLRSWANGILNAEGEPIDWGEWEIVLEEVEE